jgi:ABC-type polysaccharide/polyol phosphate transport system ATPase subunit
MGSPSVEIIGVAKRYALARARGYGTLRESLASLISGRNGGDERELWALRDVDLVVAEGDALGIIGRNGAGKTTLLKIVSHITEPTAGVARMRGRVGSLLEVGTGFHPELTGAENVYLNGAILGMSRREIRRRFDEIVGFAGLERFVHLPLKRYSSGMALRLAFSVAAHLRAEIVVVDEVLAVGDAEFQQRCLGKFSDFRAEGRTVLFVSHDLGAVTRLCDRAVWLDEGAVRAEGSPADVTTQYLRSFADEGRLAVSLAEEPSDGPVKLVAASVSAAGDGALRRAPRRDEPLVLTVEFDLRSRIRDLDVALYLVNSRGVRVIDESWNDPRPRPRDTPLLGRVSASVTVPPLLTSGDYTLGVWIGSSAEAYVHREVLQFRLLPHPADTNEEQTRPRVVRLPVSWTIETER